MSRDSVGTLPGTHQNLPDVLPVYSNYRAFKATRKDGKTSSAVLVKQSSANDKLVSLPKECCQNALDHLVGKGVTRFQDEDTRNQLAKRTEKGDNTDRSKWSSNTDVKDGKRLIKRKSEKTEKCKTSLLSHSENNTEQNRKEPAWINKGRKESCRFIDDFNQTQSSRRPTEKSSWTVETSKTTDTQRDTCASLKDNFSPRETSTPKRSTVKTHGRCRTEEDNSNAMTAEEFLQCLKKHQEDTKRLLVLIKSNDHLMKDVAHSSEEIRKVTSALNSLCKFDNGNHVAKNFASSQVSSICVHNHRDANLKSSGSTKKKQHVNLAVTSKEKILDGTLKSKTKKPVCSFSCALNGTGALGQKHNARECRNYSDSHRITKGNVRYGGQIRPKYDDTEKSVLNVTQTMPKILQGSVRGNVEFPKSSEVSNVKNQMGKDKENSTSFEITNWSTLDSDVEDTKKQLVLSKVPVATTATGSNESCNYNGNYSFQGNNLDDIAFREDKCNKFITHNDSKSTVKDRNEQFQEGALTVSESSEIEKEHSRGLVSDNFLGNSAAREPATSSRIKQSDRNNGTASTDKTSNYFVSNCERSKKQTSDNRDKASSSKCELQSMERRPIGAKLNKDKSVVYKTKQDRNRSNDVVDMHKRIVLPFDDKHVSYNDKGSTKTYHEEKQVKNNAQNNFMTSSDVSVSERPDHSSPSPEIQDDGKKRKKSSKCVKEAYFKMTNGKGGYISSKEKKSDGKMFDQLSQKEKFKADSSSERRNVDFRNDTQIEQTITIVLPNRDRWLKIGGENLSPRDEFCKNVRSRHDEKDNNKSGRSQSEKNGGNTETDANEKRAAYPPEYLEAVNKHKAILRRKMGLCKVFNSVSNVGGILVSSTMGKTLDDDKHDQAEASTSSIGENDKRKLKSAQGKCCHASEEERNVAAFPKIGTQNDRKTCRELSDSQGYGLKKGKPIQPESSQSLRAGLKCEQHFETHDKSYDSLTCPSLLSYRSSQKEKMKISSRIWKTSKKFSRYATLNPYSKARHRNCKHPKKKLWAQEACKKQHKSGGVSLKKGRENKFLKCKRTKHRVDECKVNLNKENDLVSADAATSKYGGGTKKRQTMSSMSARIWDELLKGTMLSRSKESHKSAACEVSIERTSHELKRLLHHTHFGIQSFTGAEEMASRCWKSALDEVNQMAAKPKRSITKNRLGRNIGLSNLQSQRQEQMHGGTGGLDSLSLKLSSNAKPKEGHKTSTLDGHTEKYHPNNCLPLHERVLESTAKSGLITGDAGNKITLNQRTDDVKKDQQVEDLVFNDFKENITQAYPICEATTENEATYRVGNKNLSVDRESQEKNQSSSLASDDGIDKNFRNVGKLQTKGSLSLQMDKTMENRINDDKPSTYPSSPQSPQDIFDFSWHSGDFSSNDDGEKIYFQNNIYHVEVETTPLEDGDNCNLQNTKEPLEERSTTSKSANVAVPGGGVEEDVTRKGTSGRECRVAGEMANNTFGMNRDCKEIMSNSTMTGAANIGNDAVTLDDDIMQGSRCRVTTEDGEALWIQVDDLNYF